MIPVVNESGDRVDASAISGALNSLKATGDIFKALFRLKVDAETLSRITALQGLIFEAQGNALSAQSDYAALIERETDLKKEIVRLKEWGAERENYHLSEIGRGATAYVRKPGMKPVEAAHWLCAHCYNNHRKALLQPQGNIDGERTWQCPDCKATMKVPYSRDPQDHARMEATKVLGAGAECPRCRHKSFRTQTIEASPNNALQIVGIKIHSMECSDCGFTAEREVPD